MPLDRLSAQILALAPKMRLLSRPLIDTTLAFPQTLRLVKDYQLVRAANELLGLDIVEARVEAVLR
jgi:hypothetical protein